MKFYLKIITSVIGVMFVIFLGMQAYTSVKHCSSTSNTAKSTLDNFIEYIDGDIFYSPLKKTCHRISNSNIGGWRIEGHEVDTNKKMQERIHRPTKTQKLFNILGFGPITSKNKQINNTQPGLIHIRRGDESVDTIASLILEEGLTIKQIAGLYYNRPIKIASPSTTAMPDGTVRRGVGVRVNHWMDVLTGVDEQNRNTMINTIKNKPYVSYLNGPAGQVYFTPEDGYILYNPQILIYLTGIDTNKFKDWIQTTNEFGFIERGGGSIIVEVNEGEEDEWIEALKTELPKPIIIEKPRNPGHF